MGRFCFGLCAIIVVIFGALLVSAVPVENQRSLGAKKCTWGPSFWCSNLTNAKDCRAVGHCIQTVWGARKVPEDNDSICQICKDMVKQARDQLRSNETMEELKEVLEGSCNLIPIPPVKKECCRLADDFLPELVEALSSQMNPDQVCSVAGLCNNVEIDRLMMQYYGAALEGTLTEEPSSTEHAKIAAEVDSAPTTAAAVSAKPKLTCGNCNQLATIITNKMHATNRDEILENILHLCGQMSSFSDACSSIVLTYFNDIYNHLSESLNAAGICHMSGSCSMKYHQHPEDPKEEDVDLNLLAAKDDDIPCELCQQLIHHLRDVLVANTTEEEFKQVLEGLCKQTKGFKDECLSIADQYYDVIYKSLVDNLDANGACFLIGVCPKGSKLNDFSQAEIRPLLPVFPPAEIKVTIRKLGAHEPKFTEEELKSMALPIDHLMGAANPSLLVNGGEMCTLCEYLLHFIQEELATPANEDKIKRTVNGICDSLRLPDTLRGECHNFIDMYSDAVIALLIQGLDPRQVCPKMQMCPLNGDNRHDMEVFAPKPIDESDQPTCPLCLFAVQQAQEKIKDNKTKTNIQDVLKRLCSHLPSDLKPECDDFVQTYTNELVDLLITDFKPQEICVQLKLCPKTNNYLSDLGISLEDESNEDNSAFNELDDKPVEIEFKKHEPETVAPNCWLCEEIVKNVEKKLDKHPTKADIEEALKHSCEKLKRNVERTCMKYVNEYGDKIASLVLKGSEPKMICRAIGLCLWSELEDLEVDEALKYDVIAMPGTVSLNEYDRLTGLDDIAVQEPPSCVLCEFVMAKLETELQNKTTQDDIKRTVENICHHMPKTVSKSCDKFVEQYANLIITLIGRVPPKEICLKLQLCMSSEQRFHNVMNNDVIECGVCHGAALALYPFFHQHLDHSDITPLQMVVEACPNLPGKYYEICANMMKIYGFSIMHMSQDPEVEMADVCAKIGKCYHNEQSSLAFARISA